MYFLQYRDQVSFSLTMKLQDFVKGLFQKKIPAGKRVGEEGKQYIFLWVVGAYIFQIIWVIGV